MKTTAWLVSIFWFSRALRLDNWVRSDLICICIDFPSLASGHDWWENGVCEIFLHKKWSNVILRVHAQNWMKWPSWLPNFSPQIPANFGCHAAFFKIAAAILHIPAASYKINRQRLTAVYNIVCTKINLVCGRNNKKWWKKLRKTRELVIWSLTLILFHFPIHNAFGKS